MSSHQWQKPKRERDPQKCAHCGISRIRPRSAIQAGRDEWAYLIDGNWQRSATVPKCRAKK